MVANDLTCLFYCRKFGNWIWLSKHCGSLNDWYRDSAVKVTVIDFHSFYTMWATLQYSTQEQLLEILEGFYFDLCIITNYDYNSISAAGIYFNPCYFYSAAFACIYYLRRGKQYQLNEINKTRPSAEETQFTLKKKKD